MGDRSELAFIKNALGVTGTNPQEQTALRDLLFQRLLSANIQVSGAGVITPFTAFSTSGLSVKSPPYNATGDGVTNDAAAIQAAMNTSAPVIFFPAGDYNLGSTTLNLQAGQTLVGAGIGSALTFRSRILYTGNGSAFLDTHAINSSGRAEVTMRGLYIVGSGGASTGAGIELNAGGFAFYTIDACRVGGTFKFGVIGDGIEVASITNCIFENGVGVTGSAHIWIVNGDDHRASQTLGFSNDIEIRNCQLNGADFGVIDDGGSSITITGNNFNANGIGLWMAGRVSFVVLDNAFENQGRVTHTANMRFSDRSGVGGGTFTDKSPCRAGLIAGNAFAADMAGGGFALDFVATTAAAFHSGLVVVGNWFRNNLGESAAISVLRLGRSLVGFNADDVTAHAHYANTHNDANANTLLFPGGTSDSWPATCFPGLQPQLTATKTWTPTAALADGAVSTTDVTVTGARVVDVCAASHDGIGANTVLVTAVCTANDTVRVIVMNKTGGALTIPSGISRVYVTKATV